MRTVDELINKDDPGWPLVRSWIDTAKNKVEILPVDTAKASDALFKHRSLPRSPMGTVVYMTGGLLVDHGWIRILGSGQYPAQPFPARMEQGQIFDHLWRSTGLLVDC